ncbi:MAG: 4-demethylwyosine synthase TYW1 [Candidatus Methanomethylicota archaeon]|uniref:S-adenosyl-L-methionine-dependent tRNA 4-demethylwyosine synthase n=1 Tax=Thermoproteota archaeon TaxID=2056631 RepID=A0A497EUB4_9CREN|nr:MAG: 4-demethylwyosine synthase TYW1 [Candidatus Verstraetearchaeota archaeon]
MDNDMLNDEIYSALRRQGYHIVGRHSAVKTCHWLKKSLTKGEYCYKQQFYGIQSHRCLQMTPSVVYCTNKCIYCWRLVPEAIGVSWNEIELLDVDDPEVIIDGAIAEQRRLLTGFYGNPQVDRKKLEEAMNPKHAAISLSGEPTLYPKIGELIEAFHARGMTTFLVTNGTRPDVLSKITEPTQLYISVSAPNEDKYRNICRPLIRDNWVKLNKSLELMKSFSCPTVIRLTLVKGLNMEGGDLQGYSELILKAEPTYVELKAYMHLGYSTARLKFENMPSHQEVRDFAERLASMIGYNLLDENSKSRVVLLSRLTKPIKVSRE